MITELQRQQRYQGIGSSDIPILLGEWAKYGKDQDWLFLSKTRQIEEEPPSEAMEWGVRLEPIIRGVVARQDGWMVSDDAQTYTMAAPRDWAYCHPDGRIELHPTRRGRGVLEIKNSRYYSEKKGPSDAHLAQLHWQIGVTRADYGVLAVLEAGQKLHVTEHEFDQELFDQLIRMAHTFWQRVERHNLEVVSCKN